MAARQRRPVVRLTLSDIELDVIDTIISGALSGDVADLEASGLATTAEQLALYRAAQKITRARDRIAAASEAVG